MPERVEKLQSIIKELEAEVQSIDSGDEEIRKALEKAVDDLREALREQSPDQAAPQGLVERLRRAEERFHVSHPNISGILLRIIDGLAQLGI